MITKETKQTKEATDERPNRPFEADLERLAKSVAGLTGGDASESRLPAFGRLFQALLAGSDRLNNNGLAILGEALLFKEVEIVGLVPNGLLNGR